jgi:serine/threonine-protein kinase
VDNSGGEETLTSHGLFPASVSPDGATVAGRAVATTNLDVVTVNVRSKTDGAVASTGANESEPSFSPDGRFIAYQSDESGREELYVQEYPAGSRWQLTTAGGVEPRWTSAGREIVYRNGTTLHSIAVTLRPFSYQPSQTLFSLPNLVGFDVTADGKRFVVAQDSESRENVNLVLITGWFEELKAKMRPSR